MGSSIAHGKCWSVTRTVCCLRRMLMFSIAFCWIRTWAASHLRASVSNFSSVCFSFPPAITKMAANGDMVRGNGSAMVEEYWHRHQQWQHRHKHQLRQW